jgi:hypothetical protein
MSFADQEDRSYSNQPKVVFGKGFFRWVLFLNSNKKWLMRYQLGKICIEKWKKIVL